MPRTRAGFEGYRLLREYFVMPERFHFARIDGLAPAVARAATEIEIVFLFRRPRPSSRTCARPTCGFSRRRSSTSSSATATWSRSTRAARASAARRPDPAARLRDLPLTALEDADREGPEAAIPALFCFAQDRARRRSGGPSAAPAAPARTSAARAACAPPTPATTSSLSLSAPPAPRRRRPSARLGPARSAPTATCRILDDQPALTVESGDPVQAVDAVRRAAPAAPGAARRPARGPRRREPRRRARMAAGRSALAQLSRARRRGRRRSRSALPSTLYATAATRARPPCPGDRRRRRPPGRRAAADRRPDVLRPRHRGHARNRRALLAGHSNCCSPRCSPGSSRATQRSTPSCGPAPGSSKPGGGGMADTVGNRSLV